MHEESSPPEAEPEPKKPLTAEEKEVKLQEIKDRIAVRKAQAVVDDEVAALKAEKYRRESGKEIQKAHEEYQKKQADLDALQKKRQKELDKLAHEKVKEQIRIDQLNRQAEEARKKGEVPTISTAPPAKTEFTECVLQIRMPDGTKLQGNFKPEDTLHSVISFIREKTNDNKSNLSLMTTFPKNVYSGESLNKSLKEADLVPRGMVIVNKS